MRNIITHRFTSNGLRGYSVVLLILLGLVSFGVIISWLNGTNRSIYYRVIVAFDNAVRIKKESPVLYRDVIVGKVIKVISTTKAVEVEIGFYNNYIISNDAIFEARQRGVINESIIEILPTSIPFGASISNPSKKDCNPIKILCNGSRVKGIAQLH